SGAKIVAKWFARTKRRGLTISVVNKTWSHRLHVDGARFSLTTLSRPIQQAVRFEQPNRVSKARCNVAKSYRVGIIGRTGKGDYGHGVDVAISKVPNVEIVALADENEAGRAAAAKRTNPKTTYADYREMLAKEKLDIVAICPRWIDQHRDMI